MTERRTHYAEPFEIMRGSQWAQVGADYALIAIAIATGVIAQLVLSH